MFDMPLLSYRLSSVFACSALLVSSFFYEACRTAPDPPPPPPVAENTSIVREITENYGSKPSKYLHVEFASVADTLITRGIDTAFLMKMLNEPRLKFEENLVKINVTGPIKKADYSSHYNKQSVKKCKEFIAKNLPILEAAEQKFLVPKEAIVAIMWVETKFGTVLGKNYVPSTFFSVALAGTPENIEKNIEAMRAARQPGDTADVRALEKKIEERARKKSNWAFGELLALDTLQKRSPISALELYGSSAGAFGMSQFLPSSYVRWAADGDGDGKVNLFDVPDAVFSIGNYLKVNGWGVERAEQEKAVFHYNNSKDYVAAILKLAEKLQQ